MSEKPIIKREELVVFLKQRLGKVGVNRSQALIKLQNISSPTVPLAVLVGEQTMRVAVEAIYEELKERVGQPPEEGVVLLD